jgi:uncharacterized protein involved in response to NO
MVMIGGRIVPMFTRNAFPTAHFKKRVIIEVTSVVSVIFYLIADFIQEFSTLTAIFALIAGIANLIRLSGWNPLLVLRTPILWVLHLGYAFIGFGFLTRGFSLFSTSISPSTLTHLITAGAMGTLILGMMSRVSLGHTGRPMIASRTMTIAYGLMIAGALIRILVPFLLTAFYAVGILVAAIFWTAALLLFILCYWPILTKARIDGLEG